MKHTDSHFYLIRLPLSLLVVAGVISMNNRLSSDEVPDSQPATAAKSEPAQFTTKQPTAPLKALEKQLIEQTNAFREREGLKPYVISPKLNSACQVLMADIIETGQFSHLAAGKTPAQRVAATGYKHQYLAENLFYQSGNLPGEANQQAAECIEGWKNSPGHRANLLSEKATECGIAYQIDEDQNTIYVAMKFALPELKK